MMLKKLMFVLVIAAMALAAVPSAAYAAGLSEGNTPPAAPQDDGSRLEKIWAREQSAYAKLGERLDNADSFIADIQSRLDEAAANGADITEAQAALDAFAAALKDVHPVYESAKGIIASHQGFDADGKVTDAEKAAETVQDLGAKLKEIGEALKPAGESLREALRALKDEIGTGDKAAAVWTRLQTIYAKVGDRLSHSDEFTSKLQSKLDQAAEHGVDVSAAQDALEAFMAASENAAGIWAEGQSVIDNHAGFDADGNVTDPEQAAATVGALKGVLENVKQALQPAGQALREALQALRDNLPSRQAGGERPERPARPQGAPQGDGEGFFFAPQQP